MRKLLSLTTAAAAVLLTTGALAQTGTLYGTQTLNYGTSGSPLTVAVSDALSFTKYSHAGYHLTDVYIAITAHSQASTYINNGTGSAYTWNTAGGNVDDLYVSVNGTTQADLGALTQSSLTSTTGVNKTIAGGAHYTALGAWQLDTYTDAQIADFTKLLDFSGAGSGTLSVLAPTASSLWSGSNNLTHSLTMNVYGDVSLTYYEAANPPSGTPEPGTWALLGAGACTSLAAIRRRRRSK